MVMHDGHVSDGVSVHESVAVDSGNLRWPGGDSLPLNYCFLQSFMNTVVDCSGRLWPNPKFESINCEQSIIDGTAFPGSI